MGNYLYKVTAKRIKLEDGSFANLAVFAYKPCWDGSVNRKWAKESGCHIATRFVQGKNFTGKIVLGSINDDGKTATVHQRAYEYKYGTIMDYEATSLKEAGKPVMVGKDIAKVVK